MNIERIRSLIDLFAAAPLTEMTLEESGARLHMRREAQTALPQPAFQLKEVATPPSAFAARDAAATVDVQAMLPGTLYLCSAPGEAPFVSVGSVVKAGETVAIIEAMKSMNSIVCPISGTVVSVLTNNEDVVDEGQVIIVIRPESENAAS